MKRYRTAIISLSLVAAAVIGATFWAAHVVAKRPVVPVAENPEDVFPRIQKLVLQKTPISAMEALKIISKHQDLLTENSERGRQWTDAFVSACLVAQNHKLLLELYEYAPTIARTREDAALIIASAYVNLHQPEKFKELRTLWQNSQTHADEWFILDAGNLAVQGKKDESEKMLNGRSVTGKAETERLVHLALLRVKENPNDAWNYLEKAVSIDPSSVDVRILRAQFLERMGRPDRARLEYLSGLHATSNHLYLRDQLAEFYRRHGQFSPAIKIWADALDPTTSPDVIWAKAWFWSSVTHPTAIRWSEKPCPQGPVKTLVDYLCQLPPHTFWDETSFSQRPDLQQYLSTEQCTFWLRLIQFLRDNKEEKAAALIAANPFSSESLDRDLELTLRRIFQYRNTKTLYLPDPVAARNGEKHVFFKTLDALANGPAESPQPIPENLQRLLNSEEVFSAAFSAAGWAEAALQLHRLPVIPDTFPGWVAYGVAKNMKDNRTSEETLDFALKQPSTPPLQLLIAETFIASNGPDAAMERLTPYITQDSIIGYRSAYLVSLLYMDKKQYEQAANTVNGNPPLSKSILGRETLAKIAVLQGNDAEADKIYTALDKESSEAMSYLARKAFLQKNWKRAKELTESLLQRHPDNALLRNNLALIEQQKTSND